MLTNFSVRNISGPGLIQQGCHNITFLFVSQNSYPTFWLYDKFSVSVHKLTCVCVKVFPCKKYTFQAYYSGAFGNFAVICLCFFSGYEFIFKGQCHEIFCCRFYRWQMMGTVSDYLHLKVKLKEKFDLMLTLLSKRCPNKIIKTFLIFHDLELRIFPRIFEKNGPTGICRGLGVTDSWKKHEVENLVALSL